MISNGRHRQGDEACVLEDEVVVVVVVLQWSWKSRRRTYFRQALRERDLRQLYVVERELRNSFGAAEVAEASEPADGGLTTETGSGLLSCGALIRASNSWA